MYNKRIFVVLQVNSHETLKVADLRVNCSIMNQIIDQARLIEINIAIFYDLFETLYADRIFHIAAFLILSAKIQKIMIRAKE